MTARLIAISLITAGLLASLIAGAWALIAALINPQSPRAHRTLIGYDQTLNAATGGNEDETISSRAYRACTARRVSMHPPHWITSA